MSFALGVMTTSQVPLRRAATAKSSRAPLPDSTVTSTSSPPSTMRAHASRNAPPTMSTNAAHCAPSSERFVQLPATAFSDATSRWWHCASAALTDLAIVAARASQVAKGGTPSAVGA